MVNLHLIEKTLYENLFHVKMFWRLKFYMKPNRMLCNKLLREFNDLFEYMNNCLYLL